MALTLGEMTKRILSETYRDAGFTQAVKDAIVSAIKELEINQLFLNTSYKQLQINQGEDSTELPEDFISVLSLQLLNSTNSIPGEVLYSAASGFREMTFWDLQAYKPMFYNSVGSPFGWALWGDKIYITPKAQADYFLNLYYYKRDTTYPVNDDDTSIWFGDHTADATRYTARAIFYRDSLQSPELAAPDYAKAQEVLQLLRNRNSQRENINTLSM